MTAEEMAKAIMEYNINSDCEWAQSMESEQDESECLKCCIQWLESEVGESGFQ